MKIISSYITILTLLLGNIIIANAQDSYSITDFDQLISENANSNRSQQNYSEDEIELLKNLVYDLNPLLIIDGGEYKKLGDGKPKLVIVKSNNLSQLTSITNEMQNVTLLHIKHSRDYTPGTLDLNSIKSSSLKYVLIECDFECSVPNIQNMLKNTSIIKVLYRITSEQ